MKTWSENLEMSLTGAQWKTESLTKILMKKNRYVVCYLQNTRTN